MPQTYDELRSIYLSMVSEAIGRLHASEHFLGAYRAGLGLAQIDSAILQLRKALEAIAFAAIAPAKKKYEIFRSNAEKPGYTQDYHAGRIFQVLGKINKNFYPIPLLPPVRQPNGVMHFDRKSTGYLTKKRFESAYNRLGKHLHTHNPWSNDKNLQNLIDELPLIIAEANALLELHAVFIQTETFSGTWIAEARHGTAPVIITGQSGGGFIVSDT